MREPVERRLTDKAIEDAFATRNKYAALLMAVRTWSEIHTQVGWRSHHIVDVELQEALDSTDNKDFGTRRPPMPESRSRELAAKATPGLLAVSIARLDALAKDRP